MDKAKLAELASQAKELESAELPPINDFADLHVDGDYAAYYFAGNDETPFSSSKSNMLSAIRTAQAWGGVGGSTIIHLTSGMSEKGERFKIATIKPYQGQRDSDRKPKNWEAMRTWLEAAAGGYLPGTNIRVVSWTDREADDGVAAAARYAWVTGRLPVILSRDKDFRMIPGLHIVWTTFERVHTTPTTWDVQDTDGNVYGQKWFWLQMLQGDAADNIPGLEGQPAKAAGKFKSCGASCAEEFLYNAKSAEEAWQIVKRLYELYYGQAWADRIAEQAALLWLRTDNKADVGNFVTAIPANDPAVTKAVFNMRRRISQ